MDQLQQPQLLQVALDRKDVVYSPDWVAADMVEYFKPSGSILEPCKGSGVFMRYLPTAAWCEIDHGKDFFSWVEPVDWVFGNPPYAQFTKWMTHSMEIGQNVCYLVPLNKFFLAAGFMEMMLKWGGIKHMRYFGDGRTLGFAMGYAVGAAHLQRGYRGGMTMSDGSKCREIA
jgi:hypothetical protein